jgi:small-conductance mechanosensitive channel
MSDMTHADRLYRYAVSSDSTKADNLASAAEYIQHLEAENQRLREALEHIHMTGDQSNSSGFKCANIARRALEVGAD